MTYEVVETAGEWVVRTGGIEVARFERQAAALEHVSQRLGENAGEGAVTFAMRFQARG